jgi:hypothetical protein
LQIMNKHIYLNYQQNYYKFKDYEMD